MGASQIDCISKKHIILKCRLLLYATTINHLPVRLWHVIKMGFYMTTSGNQLSGWSEKFQSIFQNQTYTKKGSWSLVVCCWSDPLQLSESLWSHYIWEVCLASWWNASKTAMPAALQLALVNRKCPILLHNITWPHVTQPVLQNLKELG